MINQIALIDGGVVKNVIVSSVEFAESLGFELAIDVTGKGVGIDWRYSDGCFTDPQYADVAMDTPVNVA